jgi:hypothetical protein
MSANIIVILLINKSKTLFLYSFSEELYNKDLISVSITKLDFINEILKIVFEKYNINLTAEGWNNFGDSLQDLAVLYLTQESSTYNTNRIIYL